MSTARQSTQTEVKKIPGEIREFFVDSEPAIYTHISRGWLAINKKIPGFLQEFS